MKIVFLSELPMLDGQYLHLYFLWVIIIFMHASKVKRIFYLLFGVFCFKSIIIHSKAKKGLATE